MNDMIAVSVPDPVVTLAGGIIRREYKIPAGMVLLAHVHDYDHLSVLMSGEARLYSDGKPSMIKAPHMLIIKAGVEHGLYALTECVWDCLHGFTHAKDAHERGDPYAFLGVKE